MIFQERCGHNVKRIIASRGCRISETAWSETLAAKMLFLTEGFIPDESPYVRREIAASWVRSAEEKVDPCKKQMGTVISDLQHQDALRENASLIIAAKSALDMVKRFGLAEDFVFELINPQGVKLVREGGFDLRWCDEAKVLSDESTMGTNAHSLCMKYKVPFQVVGPEHYCYALHDLAASAAPIVDEDDQVVASLLLTQHVPPVPWVAWFQKLLSCAFGLITSSALAMSHQLQCPRCKADVSGRGVRRDRRQRSIVKTDMRIAAEEKAEAHFSDILGSCSGIEKALEEAKRFAPVRENVLIAGETGTGKDLFAQAMHNLRCPEGPFVVVRCATISPRFAEGYLFGYEAGGFVGSGSGGRPGKLERADGGTLFLDEVSTLPLEVQAVLSRVLEDGVVMRLGGKRTLSINCKVIAATNADLETLVEQGAFRKDLLYRLSALTISLPPVRDRGADKLLLARSFLGEMGKASSTGPRLFSRKAEAVLRAYLWPGNVRELKNAVTSAFYRARTDDIRPDDLPLAVRGLAESAFLSKQDFSSILGDGSASVPSITALEKKAIALAMKCASGNVEEASEMLGISRATLYRRLRQYGIQR